jgi:hypothetical protein
MGRKRGPRPDNSAAYRLKDTKQEDVNDWRKPWFSLLELVNLVICHAVGILAIAAIANGLEFIITSMSGQPLVWTARGVSVSLSNFINYGDLLVFLAFFLVAIVDIARWVARSR